MSDLRIVESKSPLEAITMDLLLLPSHTIDESDQLATSVRVALGTDAMANANDILPDPDSTDRRGWWGDMDAEQIWGGWPIGCKNWLLTRAKITDAISIEGATLDRARQYTLQALQPFVNQRVASAVEVDAEIPGLTARVPNAFDRIYVTATLYRGPQAEIELRYQLLWDEIANPVAAVIPAAIAPTTFDITFQPQRANLVLSSDPIVGINRFVNPPSAQLALSVFLSAPHPITVAQNNLAITATIPQVIHNQAAAASLIEGPFSTPPDVSVY